MLALMQLRHPLMKILSTAIAAMFVAYAASIWWWHQIQQDNFQHSISSLIAKMLPHSQQLISDKLFLVAHPLLINRNLQQSMLAGDRDALQRQLITMFEEIRRVHGITHLYFHDATGHNLLRMHQPQRFGDLIDRKTMAQAMNTGHPAVGLELEPLGTLTIRAVLPWMVDGVLIGYIETGMEISKELDYLKSLTGMNTYVLLDKHQISRERWEESMRLARQQPEWDELKDYVITAHSEDPLSLQLEEILQNEAAYNAGKLITISQRQFALTIQPLHDASRKPVAKLIVVNDVSDAYNQIHFMESILMVSGLLVSVLTFYGGSQHLLRLERCLQATETERDTFHDLMHRDSLTGLYNQKHFYDMLTLTLTQAQRTGERVAVLMMDIDFFKRINDTYGHRAGDEVLRTMAARLQAGARSRDIVARYGGEEFAMIMHSTSEANAMVMAERMRMTASVTPIRIESGPALTITLSAGLAIFPAHAVQPGELVQIADAALYQAKENGRNQLRAHTGSSTESPPSSA